MYVRSSTSAILIATLIGCSSTPAPAPATWPTEAWETATPESQGVSSVQLAAALDFLQRRDLATHGLLIVRHGRLLMDASFFPYDGVAPHDVASVTKSITSTLVGAAIHRGLIQNVDAKVVELLPDVEVANPDPRKSDLTVEDLLTMRAGFEALSDGETVNSMMASDDWPAWALGRTLDADPGTQWHYDSASSHLLSAIVQRAAGKSLRAFGQEALFGPLGIDLGGWPENPAGENHGWGDVHIHARDLAKLGLLLLHNGVWDGARLLPVPWANDAGRPHVDFEDEEGALDSGYGYHWWTYGDGLFGGKGRGQQHLLVHPGLDLIVVVLAGDSGEALADYGELLTTHLIPAASSSTPLPEDPAAVAALERGVAQALQPPPPAQDVPPAPPAAAAISGRRYLMQPNDAGIRAVTLTFDESAEASLRLELDGGDLDFTLGLDGVPRFNGSASDPAAVMTAFDPPIAATGRWTDATTFETRLDEIENINDWIATLRVDGAGIRLALTERTWFFPPTDIPGAPVP